MSLKRFGVSIPKDLLKHFDDLIEQKGYIGRSEAIRDAMRLFISKYEWESSDVQGFASLNIVYEHKPRVMAELLKNQHNSEAEVISTLHTHIAKTHCFEIITIRGNGKGIQRLADRIGAIKGIEFLELFTFSLPPNFENIHNHRR
ncbi:MAG: nickel-responsive transcriptional regulator NikR [Candidatus Thorarchaeota archaeon]